MTPFRRVALTAALLAFVVVVVGAWVRLSAAGLGCPDWPGCYGHLTVGGVAANQTSAQEAFPDRPFVAHKALKEMIHRYVASTLGFLILILAVLAFKNRRDPDQPVILPFMLVGLVILQGLLGMWTVTLLLKPLIVVLHLIGGLSILALCAWLSMAPQPVAASEDAWLRKFAVAGLAILSVQIILGGWTSTNYAALACPDFPTCQRTFWPDMDMKDAFILWRGLGIDYEGGVLDHPARVAIHFVHRLGAITAALVLGIAGFLAWRRGKAPIVRSAGLAVLLMLLTQLFVGPLMVMEGMPLGLATAHNAVAALLLIAVVRFNRVLAPRRQRIPREQAVTPHADPGSQPSLG
jgi:cytochrome c oxidase assembly protein subunit 15